MSFNAALIRSLINEGEREFLACWELLCRIKHATITREELLAFQPRLASTIFQLDSAYHALAKEQRRLVAKKESLNPGWFQRRMAYLAHYQKLVSRASRRGKMLGDTFAWLFYHQEEEQLHQHLKHPYNLKLPGGVGGQAEVAFIQNYRLLSGRLLPLYHGATTFLRAGDLSLIDVESFKLVGIGEVKAGAVHQGRCTIHVVMMTRQGEGTAPGAQLHAEWVPGLNPPASERLKRQLEKIRTALEPSTGRKAIDLKLASQYRSLDGLAAEAVSAGVAFRQISPSLAVQATTFYPRRSFYSRLLKPVPSRARRRLDEFPIDKVLPLVLEGAQENALWIGQLSPYYLPGATPLFWTSIDEKLIDGMFREELAVTTFYNPARLIENLRSKGFEVSLAPNKPQIIVYATVGGHRVQFEGIQYYLTLIQARLANEESVAAAMKKLVDSLDQEELEPGVSVQILPVQARPKA